MRTVLPGVLHWTVRHPRIGIDVSSYLLVDERVLIDPLVPAEGVDALPCEPRRVLLTNRHHFRDSQAFVDRFGCTVHCVASGLHEFQSGEPVVPFDFGDDLGDGIVAVEIGAICPDETALWSARGEGLVALADGVIRDGDGPLRFVPDELLGDDPEALRAGLRRAYARLCERAFDHLLLAHGEPWIGGGRAALAEFAAG